MRKDNEQFINEAKAVHGDKYNYSKVEYKNFKRYSKNIPKNTYCKTNDILKIIKNHVI